MQRPQHSSFSYPAEPPPAFYPTMGGGASTKKAIVPKAEGEALVHTGERNFCAFLDLYCQDFKGVRKSSPDETRRVCVKLYARKYPFACENFRRLCCATGSAAPGPAAGGFGKVTYRGSLVHDVQPGISVSLGRMGGEMGRKKGSLGRSVSAFKGGAPWVVDAKKRPVDVERGSLCMVNSEAAKRQKGAQDGTFGSEFMLYLGDDGSATTALLNDSANHLVIGRVCEGICVLDDISELMSSTKWACKLIGGTYAGKPPQEVRVASCGECEAGYKPPRKMKKRQPLFKVNPTLFFATPAGLKKEAKEKKKREKEMRAMKAAGRKKHRKHRKGKGGGEDGGELGALEEIVMGHADANKLLMEGPDGGEGRPGSADTSQTTSQDGCGPDDEGTPPPLTRELYKEKKREARRKKREEKEAKRRESRRNSMLVSTAFDGTEVETAEVPLEEDFIPPQNVVPITP